MEKCEKGEKGIWRKRGWNGETWKTRKGVQGEKMEKRTIHVVSAAIERDGSYLITQRLEKAVFPLLWEFPGGKIEAGENKEQALARELEYRLGVEANVLARRSESGVAEGVTCD